MGTAERLRYRGAEKTRVSHMQAKVLSKQNYSLWGTFAESVALGRNAERSRESKVMNPQGCFCS